MVMKQVIQNARSGKLALLEAPPPAVRAGHILVRTEASLISAGTERSLLAFSQKSLAGKARARPDLVKKVLAKAKQDGIRAAVAAVKARLDEPLPLGYSAAGEVIEVGAGLEGVFKPGQRAAIGGAGIANHAEINVVPRNLAAIVPAGVSAEEACFSTIGAVALHAVRNLNPGLGDVIAVIGAGLIGQLASQLLTLAGARVLAIDYDKNRLALARHCGAEAVFALNGGNGGLAKTVAAMTNEFGCDGVLIAAAAKSSEPLETAAAIARDRAVICLAGQTGTAFSFADFMKKELKVIVSRSYGPGRYDRDYEGRGVKYPEGWVRWTETGNMAECLRLMAMDKARRLDVGKLISHRFPIGQAGKAYALIGRSKEPSLGVVLTYTGGKPKENRPLFPVSSAKSSLKASGDCVLGVIGAGAFAKSTLLPILKKMHGVALHTVVARRGASAAQTAADFGFAHASADADDVLGNPAINAVLIATRHDSHAKLTERALKAGKAVLVEKPLGLSRQEIAAVVKARNKSQAFFQVGFNRRFAPLAIEARERLAKASGPKFILIRINAGGLQDGSWVNDHDEGGGRVLGEVCHFVDLARFLMGSRIASVQADAADGSGGENLTVILNFENGGLANIAYTGLGDKAMGKELIEVYAGGVSAAIDDFRAISFAGNGVFRAGRRIAQDKGIKAELHAFAAAVNSGHAPIDEAELVETSIATIAALESLRTGSRITL